MSIQPSCQQLFSEFIVQDDHARSDYFSLIRALLKLRAHHKDEIEPALMSVYSLLEDELKANRGVPRSEISFGTSGWRGILGKDIYVRSVECVTRAIIRLYTTLEKRSDLAEHLGVSTLAEAQQRGCLVGHDNRFGGELLGRAAAQVLLENGFRVYWCGETATGVLSAALLELNGAFSINLTPSHNPLEYGGYKYNAADAGPAAAELTTLLTAYAREIVKAPHIPGVNYNQSEAALVETDSFGLWQQFVRKNSEIHRLNYDNLLHTASENDDLLLVIDSVHGASRLHIERFLGPCADKLRLLRGEEDVTFGGIAPEPSSVNMSEVTRILQTSRKKLKLGAIIDPDADRIRFTDGTTEISMNQFGAMAYYFLHERRELKGMVAKTVATSNFANSIAAGLKEEVFETRVGFKEFKPVIGKALVCFEESDGISIIGHTPEKDAYIGLVLALAMVLEKSQNLGDIKAELEQRYGAFYPERDGVAVKLQGEPLAEALRKLEKFQPGERVRIGQEDKLIKTVISIDGTKIIFEDGSWLMIRASGTEPKVRFYVESRNPDGTDDLVQAAQQMLSDAGLL